MTLEILKIDGKPSGKKIKLDEAIFGIEPNDHAIYLAVKALQANKRQGTHKAKERSEVRGGGKKPWRQKRPRNSKSRNNKITTLDWRRYNFRPASQRLQAKTSAEG